MTITIPDGFAHVLAERFRTTPEQITFDHVRTYFNGNGVADLTPIDALEPGATLLDDVPEEEREAEYWLLAERLRKGREGNNTPHQETMRLVREEIAARRLKEDAMELVSTG